MPYKPFLSHKREDADELGLLRDELCLRGAGGWQDVDELRIGQRWKVALRRAVGSETGGFIWWATPATLTSDTIRRIEVRSALRRAQRQRGGAYPFVPLFVGLSPGKDDEAIKKAFGRRRGQQLLDLNGVMLGADENLSDFSRRAARRYVHDLVRDHDDTELRVAITGSREPSGQHDLSLDWRRLLDADGRVLDATVIPTLVETLTDVRDAAHKSANCPHIVVEPHLRLPLGALVGWEWNRVRPVALTVVQPSGRGHMVIDDLPADPGKWGSPVRQQLGGRGPAVLAVSVGKNLGEGVLRYAQEQKATEVIHLHVDVDNYPNRVMPAEDICALSQWTIDRLAELNARDAHKHLLLLGPVSLAVRIGAAANGTGRTFVPFWDGAAGYTSGVFIG